MIKKWYILFLCFSGCLRHPVEGTGNTDGSTGTSGSTSGISSSTSSSTGTTDDSGLDSGTCEGGPCEVPDFPHPVCVENGEPCFPDGPGCCTQEVGTNVCEEGVCVRKAGVACEPGEVCEAPYECIDGTCQDPCGLNPPAPECCSPDGGWCGGGNAPCCDGLLCYGDGGPQPGVCMTCFPNGALCAKNEECCSSTCFLGSCL